MDNVEVSDFLTLRNKEEIAKQKYSKNGFEFYRIRMGINDLPKIRFEKSEPPSNIPKIKRHLPNFGQLHCKLKEQQSSYGLLKHQTSNNFIESGNKEGAPSVMNTLDSGAFGESRNRAQK